MTDQPEFASYSVRVSGDGQADALLRALDARPNMRLAVRGAVGTMPPGGSADLNDLPIKGYSIWVDEAGSGEDAKRAVEGLLAEAGIPGAVQDVRQLGD
ncbi:MAG TPA: hypothetical protein VFU16_06840 [Solirubrobacterales bacterium]|nr:hypothetical protein [Solirubrobacterales bacterium]